MPTVQGKNFYRWKTYLEIGKKFMEPIWREADLCRQLLECPPEQDKIKVRILKRLAQMFTDKIFPRDPEVIAKAKRPMPGPIPIDPATGMPAVDPMTGEFAPPEDLSEKRAELVELVLNDEFSEMGLTQELRAAIHDSFIYPVGAIQSGYAFDENREIDSAYVRRRSIKDLIFDPNIETYFGQIHNCRFIGVKLKLTREDCKVRGIDHTKIPEHDQTEEGESQLFFSPDQQRESGTSKDDWARDCVRYHVWQIWDINTHTYTYMSENAEEAQGQEKPWPWKLKGFPVKILSMDRIPDKPFGHSVVYDMQDQQLEINDLRTTMHDEVVDAKPFTVFDPQLLDPDKISQIANRRKDLHVPVTGLAGKMIEQFFKKINPDGMSQEQLVFYDKLKEEIYDVGGASSNDRFEATNATATEAAIIEKASALMSGAKSASVTIFARDVIRDGHAIIEQTYTTDRITQVTSPDMGNLWVSWNGPQFLRDFNVNLDMSNAEPSDPTYERKKAVELYNIMSAFPGANPFPFGLDILKAYGKRKPERYLMQVPPMIPGVTAPAPGQAPPKKGGPK